jgi:hypothetical protein
MRFIALSLLFVFSAMPSFSTCTGSGTSFSCTAGTTVAQVQSTVNSAGDGATITFAAGSYSWGNGIALSNSKGVTLQGAGAGSSIVTVTGAPVIYMDTISGNNTRNYRITGFTFQNAPSNLILWFYGSGSGILNNMRIDHNTFSNFATGAIALFFGETSFNGKFFGLVDHNTFKGPNNFMIMKILGTAGNPNNWAASVRGSSNNLFLEDNVIDYDSANDLGAGCIDAWNSASVVFRYNTTRNCLVTSHGVDHGGGSINFEVYGNTLQRQGGDSTWQNGTRLIHHQGSGEIFIWNNVFKHSASPISDSAISVTYYRSATPSAAGYSSSLGQCNGNSSLDGNTSPSSTYHGWPCWMQPGRAPAGGSPGYGTLSPMYVWGNTDGSTGNAVPVAIDDPWGSYVNSHIVANRDYYNAISASAQSSMTSPFNGTTGMGFGTLANRPATCMHTTAPNGENTGGVGYFATDQNVLYRCSATNTWTAWYTPYSYPHPLQGGTPPLGGPPAPSLQLTVQ